MIIAEFESFMKLPKPITERILVGRGVCGKSRLALKLCRKYAENWVWNAWEIEPEELQNLLNRQTPPERIWG